MDKTHLLRNFRGKAGYCGHFRGMGKLADFVGLRLRVHPPYDSCVTAILKKQVWGLYTVAVAVTAILISCAAAGLPTAHPATKAPQALQGPEHAAATEQFQEIVTTLSTPQMEGRGPGTAGLDKARDYLVEQYRLAGLEPMFGDQYVQQFEIDNGVKAAKQSLAGGDHGFKPGPDFSVMGFSASAAFEGEAVFVGYGIENNAYNYNSYAHMKKNSLRGRVAIAMRFEPQNEKGVSRWAKRGQPWTHWASMLTKAKWAAQRGATALLFVNPPSQKTPLKSLRRSAGPQAPIPVMHISPETFMQIAGNANLKSLQRAADDGEQPARLLNAMNITGEVQLKRARASVYNVAGQLPGAGALKDQIVVIGAHYDHLGYGDAGSMAGTQDLHPGADDNASGTAGLIMLANRLANNKSPNRRTIIIIAFTAEERGLLGSVHFVEHLKESGIKAKQIVAMVNMDMIGRLDKHRLYVFGIKSGDRWQAIVKKAADDQGLTLMTKAISLGASDHASFFLHQVPAVHFFTGLHGDYHRPSDTSDKINAAGGAKVVACIAQVVGELITDQPRMVFNRSGAKLPSMLRSAGGRAFLGIMPDYAAKRGKKGCSITAITPGGPASIAKLKVGDLIVRWDKHKIRKVNDLSRLLFKSEPEQTISLKVQRGSKLLTIPVKLGYR